MAYSSKIFFTVCNYNAHKTCALDKSLENLLKIKDDNTKIAYFDNASKDGSDIELLKYYQMGVIDILILSKKNMGKAYAMNTLFKSIVRTYESNGNDILINLDSDISIVDVDFLNKTRDVFSVGNIKYLGYQMFLDESMTIPTMHTYKSSSQINIHGHKFDVLNNQHGLGGGILAMLVNHYIAVNGYNENLGKDHTPAIYGGDDAVLIMKLFKKFPTEIALCHLDKMVIHPETIDKEYQKWKDTVNSNMCFRGFGNNTLPEKGFYD